VLVEALLAVAATTYTGTAPDGGAVTVVVRGGRVVRATATATRYRCAQNGDIGPLRVSVSPGAPVSRGRFAFAAGPRAERLFMTGELGRGGRLRGTFRVRGTIALGDPCVSPRVAFTALSRRPGRR
jgi:hypothetical protein